MRWFVLAAAWFALASCGSEAPADGERVTLRFSAIPDHDETLLRQKYEPIAAYLSEQLQVPVEYVHATEYADAVELFKSGDVQLAWFGGLSGVQARAAVPNARAIVQGKADPEFRSYFVANVDTDVQRSAEFPLDLRGKTFAFGSKGSTSGRLMPEYFVRKHGGAPPESFFAGPLQFAGTHDKTAKMVESGAVDAGALNYKTYDRMVASGELDPEVCRIVWTTPPYADYNFTVHPVVEESHGKGFIAKLQRVLIGMGPEQMAAFDREKFIAASNRDYGTIEKLAHELGFVRR